MELIKPRNRGGDSVLRAEEEALQSQRLRVARRNGQAFLQALHGRPGAAKTEFHFRDPLQSKTEVGRLGRRLPGHLEGFLKLPA